MFIKVFQFVLFILALFRSLNGNQINKRAEISSIIKPYSVCLIENENYKDEFFYASPQEDDDEEWKTSSTQTKQIININKTSRFQIPIKNVFVNELKLKYMTTIDQAEWLMRPVNWFNDTFYISSVKYPNNHLCATHKFFDLFNLRRKIHLIRLNKESLTTNYKCMWRVTEIESIGLFEKKTADTGYVLWNEYYEEPLYAASYLFKTARNRRTVYTWHGLPNSRQFLWRINCF